MYYQDLPILKGRSLAASINKKTGKTLQQIHSDWMISTDRRLVDPLEMHRQ